MPFLDEILKRKADEVSAAKSRRNVGDLKLKAKDAPPLRSFCRSVSDTFGLIAEVKRKSPSAGLMRPDNFNGALAAYNSSGIVSAISVLTDSHFFGMSVDSLLSAKAQVHHSEKRLHYW